jgi:hypothetical protein
MDHMNAEFVLNPPWSKLSHKRMLKQGTVNESHECYICTKFSRVESVTSKHVKTEQ